MPRDHGQWNAHAPQNGLRQIAHARRRAPTARLVAQQYGGGPRLRRHPWRHGWAPAGCAERPGRSDLAPRAGEASPGVAVGSARLEPTELVARLVPRAGGRQRPPLMPAGHGRLAPHRVCPRESSNGMERRGQPHHVGPSRTCRTCRTALIADFAHWSWPDAEGRRRPARPPRLRTAGAHSLPLAPLRRGAPAARSAEVRRTSPAGAC